tara:strand:+ start:319 stop:495 length:177 start_codon:yes stop_codon:yes gene_type:complete
MHCPGRVIQEEEDFPGNLIRPGINLLRVSGEADLPVMDQAKDPPGHQTESQLEHLAEH